MTYLERLLARRASWEREIQRQGPMAKVAPKILAQIELELAELAAAR
jgi:hypothetical protein